MKENNNFDSNIKPTPSDFGLGNDFMTRKEVMLEYIKSHEFSNLQKSKKTKTSNLIHNYISYSILLAIFLITLTILVLATQKSSLKIDVNPSIISLSIIDGIAIIIFIINYLTSTKKNKQDYSMFESTENTLKLAYTELTNRITSFENALKNFCNNDESLFKREMEKYRLDNKKKSEILKNITRGELDNNNIGKLKTNNKEKYILSDIIKTTTTTTINQELITNTQTVDRIKFSGSNDKNETSSFTPAIKFGSNTNLYNENNIENNNEPVVDIIDHVETKPQVENITNDNEFNEWLKNNKI